jgi:hypothetical protein
VLKTLKNYKVKVVLSGVQPGVYDELIKSGIEQYIEKELICSHYDIAKPKAIEVLNQLKRDKKKPESGS